MTGEVRVLNGRRLIQHGKQRTGKIAIVSPWSERGVGAPSLFCRQQLTGRCPLVRVRLRV